MSYEDIYSEDSVKKFGNIIPPAIFIDDRLFSEGHVPIMKKLALELYKLTK